MHIKKYKPDSEKQLIKLNKIQASDLRNIESDNYYQKLDNELFIEFHSSSFQALHKNIKFNKNLSIMSKRLKSPKLLILNFSKNRTKILTPNSSKIQNYSVKR